MNEWEKRALKLLEALRLKGEAGEDYTVDTAGMRLIKHREEIEALLRLARKK